MKSLVKTIQHFSRKISAHRVGAYSAQTAFFMLFSLFPLFILVLSLSRRLIVTSDDVINILGEYAPDVMMGFLNDYLGDIILAGSVSLTIVSAVTLLWSASKGIFSIIGGLNSINEIKEGRNYFVLRLLAVFYTVAFVIMLVLALVLMVFGNVIADFIYQMFPSLKGLVYLISSLRYILSFLFLVLFFMLVYKILPGKKMRFMYQLPGAVVSSAGWVSFSILFSIFVNNFSSYANIYGSLTAIMLLLLWMYVCMYIMFIGAEINLYLLYSRNDTTYHRSPAPLNKDSNIEVKE